MRKVYTVLVGTPEKERPVGTLACGDVVVRGCELDLCDPAQKFYWSQRHRLLSFVLLGLN